MKLRRYLVAGILVWLPLGVTFFLLSFLIGLADKTLNLLPARYRPDQWSLPEWVPDWLAAILPDAIPGLGFVLTVIVLLLTGLLAANRCPPATSSSATTQSWSMSCRSTTA